MPPLIFAAATIAATVALMSAAQPAPHNAVSVSVTADGDDTFVNDNGQTPGDVFTQNAQDQSTA
ncbi:hypothetical protein [Mycobacterium sp. Marseille-P9652]|uniref:hypothetical protein n=1 Tax=Mycobacterium sp. Marseille-P9652 TaxID=2654950 RepID=UPI0018D116B3|nr:hypothetical protein [Mycobacterium sp. Marseille-P9652]